MAIAFTRYLQGGTPTEISATDILQFAGAGGFDDPVFITEYNSTTHVKTAASADKSSGNTPNNNKFISQTGGTGGDSQADWGDGTEDLDQILDAEAALHINIADASAFAVSNAIIYSYDGVTTTDPLANLDVRMAEVGDTNFTEAEGSAAALALTDQGSATSHDYYIVISKSPTTIGLKEDVIRMECIVS